MYYNIDINSQIGPGYFSKQLIKSQLEQLKNKPVNMRISSLGGSLAHGLDIRQQLVDHGNVTAYLYGMVASAATIIATGAKKVCISKYCLFLVHKVSNYVSAWGQYNADDLARLIEDLEKNKAENDKIDRVLAQMYAQKTGKSVDEILDVLTKNAWMTAQEAKDWGFVDEIIEGDEEKVNFADQIDRLNSMNLPPLPEKFVHPDSSEAVLSTWLNRLTERLESWFKGKENNQTQTQSKNDMIKTYDKINSTLGIQGLEENNGKPVVTDEQLSTLNDRLNTLEQDLQARDTTIQDLQNQIEALKKNPGDDTHNLVDQEGEKGAAEHWADARELFNQLD